MSIKGTAVTVQYVVLLSDLNMLGSSISFTVLGRHRVAVVGMTLYHFEAGLFLAQQGPLGGGAYSRQAGWTRFISQRLKATFTFFTPFSFLHPHLQPIRSSSCPTNTSCRVEGPYWTYTVQCAQ